jgi:hypothetical protein
MLFGETIAVYCHAMLMISLNSRVLFFDGGHVLKNDVASDTLWTMTSHTVLPLLVVNWQQGGCK